MRYLTLDEVLELHRLTLKQAGGTSGLRDKGALESAIAQPLMTFEGVDLYPSLAERLQRWPFHLSRTIRSLTVISESDMQQWKLSWF